MTVELITESIDDVNRGSAPTTLRLQVLGPLRLWRGDTELSAGPPQQAALLGILLAREGRPTGTDELVDVLWGEQAPTSALNVLHKYIGAIRRILEPDLPPRAPGRYLTKLASGYVCAFGPGVLDLTRFRQLAGRARSARAGGRAPAALAGLIDAVALWNGPVGDGWAQGIDAAPIFSALNEEFFEACVELAATADSLDESARALPALRRAAAMAPLHEPVQAALVTLLGRVGRRAEAVEVFGTVRRRLADELGIDPGADLRTAFQGVLGPTSNRRGGEPAAASPAVAPVRPVRPDPADSASGDRGAEPRLVGRTQELLTLRSALRPAWTGGRAVIVVEGDAGVGKSRIIESLAQDASAQGALVVWGHCLQGDGAPAMWPWVQLAQGLLDALPEARGAHWLSQGLGPLLGAQLGDTGAGPDRNARRRLIEQMVGVIGECGADRPVVLVLDDIQWAEASSLQVLDSVVERLPGGVAVIAVLRARCAVPSHELIRTLATMSRTSGHRRVSIGAFTPAEVGELLHNETGIRPADHIVDAIHQRTAGNPFFVQELARLLGAAGVGSIEAATGSGVPLTVRDVVRDRLAAVSADTIALLEVAALIGRSVELLLLAQATSLDVVTCLERLEPARELGLIEPVADDPFCYRYTHDLVRQAVSEGIAACRRSAVHGGIADAIEAGALRDESAVERLAHHLWAAGPVTDPERTVSALLAAGTKTLTKTSLQAAERHLTAAVEMARKSSLPRLELAGLSQLIAVVGMRSMYGVASVSLLERAEHVARSLGDERLATGFLYSRWAAYGQDLQLEQSAVLAEQLERLASTSNDPVAVTFGVAAAGIHRWCVGEIGESFRRLDTISHALVPKTDPGAGAPVTDGVQLMAAGMFAEIAGYHGDLERADHLFASIRAAAGHDPYTLTVATAFEARTAAVAGDALGALRAAEQGIAADPEFSFVSLGTYLRLARWWGRAMTGLDPADAARNADQLIRSNLSKPARTCISTWLALLAEMHLAAGSPSAAAAALDRADDALNAYGQRSAEALVLLVRAELAKAVGDRRSAGEAARRAYALARRREANLFADRAERLLTEL